MTEKSPTSIIELAAEIVAAYVANNSIPLGVLPALIQNVHSSLDRISNGTTPNEPKVEELRPAVPIKKSITDDYLISLEDGRKLKSMKRYLSALGMTPQQYREKWGLPKDYPMVAPNYAAQRSALAKSLGLGQLRRERSKTEAAEPASDAAVSSRRGVKQAA